MADPVVDTFGLFGLAMSLPEQVAAAASGARGVVVRLARERVEHVVVMGMGGSGVAGDVLAAAAGPYLPVPVIVAKGYECPAFVGEGSLVFAVSCSGDTEETLEAVAGAVASGAAVVAVTQGGELARRAAAWDVPVVPVPAEIPAPRAALGALSIPAFVVLEELGLFPGAQQWIDFAVDQLTRRREQLTGEGSLAVELAREIDRTIPVIYGGGHLGAVAASRFKNQVNENAKAPAFWNTSPELCHNEICGWGQGGDVTRQTMTVVNLRHDFEHPQVARRFEVVEPLLEEVVAQILEVRAEGEGELAQLLDLVLIGDLVSLHLATQQGVDPGPTPVLAHIKAALAT